MRHLPALVMVFWPPSIGVVSVPEWDGDTLTLLSIVVTADGDEEPLLDDAPAPDVGPVFDQPSHFPEIRWSP